MERTLTISKRDVMDEVKQRTSYSGIKMGDQNALDRIGTIDEDEIELDRFWEECRSDVAQAFIRLLKSEGMNSNDADKYNVSLNVSESFDDALLPSMELGLFNFFVQSIVTRWFMFTNKQEVESNAKIGMSILDDVRQKAFYKKLPSRPVYN